MRMPSLRPLLQRLCASSVESSSATRIRSLHKTRQPPPVPQTRPFVPNVHTFLTLIGRGLSRYSSKFPTWESLFSLTTIELKELGIEPPRTRRYLLEWLQRYRDGAFGPGGDFEHVKNGEALLRVALPPASVLSKAKWVVNVPCDEPESGQTQPAPASLPRPNGYVVRGTCWIQGPYVRQLKGHGRAVVRVTEGMWEMRQGRKIDGGERRRAEVRFKRRSAERRAKREAEISGIV